jgi:hypothetical protein
MLPPITATVPVTLATCDEKIPLLSITRQFDFGQFITLYYDDPTAADRKPPRAIVITEQGGLATSQAAMHAAISAAEIEGYPSPTFVEVDASTVDLFDVMGADAHSNRLSVQVTINDVPAFLACGIIEKDGVTYKVAIDDKLERTLSAGYSTVAEATIDRGPETAQLLLIPYVKAVTLTRSDINRLIAGEPVTLDIPGRRGDLSPAVIRALLGGKQAIIRATGGGNKSAPVLVQIEGSVNRPAVLDLRITDLPAFLAHPQVPGRNGMPIDVSLTTATVDALRHKGEAEIKVGATTVRVNVVQASAAAATGVVNIGESLGTGIYSVVDQPDPQTQYRDMLNGWQPSEALEVEPTRLAAGTLELRPLSPLELAPWSPQKKSLDELILPRLVPGMGLPVALFVPWRQTWKLKGFSRGNLLQSLAMAPQEEIVIELSSWERTVGPVAVEQSSETDIKQALASSQTSTDTNDIFDELMWRHDFSWQLSGSIDATISSTGLTVSTGVDAFEKGADDLARVAWNSRTNMKEATNKAAESVRARRTTRITQSTETGGEGRVRRKIRNPNQCHTVTYDFFEILAHYEIELDFMPQRLRLVAMVPNPVNYDNFDPLLVRANETALIRGLIDPALAGGFEALRLTRAYEFAQGLINIQANEKRRLRDELMQKFKTQSRVSTDPIPPSPQEVAVLEILAAIQKSIRTIHDSASISPSIALNLLTMPNTPLDPLIRQNFRRWLFLQLCAVKLPGVFAALNELMRSSTPPDISAARMLLAALPGPGRTPTLGTLNDMTPAEKQEAGLGQAIQNVIGGKGHGPAFLWYYLGRCHAEGMDVADDMSIATYCDALQRAFRNWETKRDEGDMEIAKDVLVKLAEAKQDLASGLQDITTTADQLSIAFPFDDLARAQERQEALLKHLNDHKDHYNYAIFQSLPLDEQTNRIVMVSQNRLQIGMFEPRVVAMDGKNLAVPLTSFGQSGIREFVDYMAAALTKSLAHPVSGTPEDWNDTAVVPTPGVTMSSRLGACSTCEDFIEKTRDLELIKLDAFVRQEVAEATRLEARLEAKDFSDPTAATAAVRIAIDKEPI